MKLSRDFQDVWDVLGVHHVQEPEANVDLESTRPPQSPVLIEEVKRGLRMSGCVRLSWWVLTYVAQAQPRTVNGSCECSYK